MCDVQLVGNASVDLLQEVEKGSLARLAPVALPMTEPINAWRHRGPFRTCEVVMRAPLVDALATSAGPTVYGRAPEIMALRSRRSAPSARSGGDRRGRAIRRPRSPSDSLNGLPSGAAASAAPPAPDRTSVRKADFPIRPSMRCVDATPRWRFRWRRDGSRTSNLMARPDRFHRAFWGTHLAATSSSST